MRTIIRTCRKADVRCCALCGFSFATRRPLLILPKDIPGPKSNESRILYLMFVWLWAAHREVGFPSAFALDRKFGLEQKQKIFCEIAIPNPMLFGPPPGLKFCAMGHRGAPKIPLLGKWLTQNNPKGFQDKT